MFQSVFRSSLSFVEQSPLTPAPHSVAHIRDELRGMIKTATQEIQFPPVAELAGRDLQADHFNHPVGLNTVGLLLDRLSILAIKDWNLRHRRRDDQASDALRAGPVIEIVEALESARPGHSSFNAKLTIHDRPAEARTFAQAYRSLLTSNLLLWEAQEVLYNREINDIHDHELRDYIVFFTSENLARNAFMVDADRLYWAERNP